MTRIRLGLATAGLAATLNLGAGGAWAPGRPQDVYHALLGEADHHGSGAASG